jgi:hypothetical protein
VALLIGVLGAAVLTALAGARRTDSSYDRFRRATKAHDALAFSASEAQLERVAQLPEVAAAAIGSGFPALVDVESQFDLGILASPGQAFGHTVDVPRYLSGRPPRQDQPDEVALNEQAAAQLHARVGSTVVLQTLTPEQQAHIEEEFSGRLEGPRLRLRVTGIARGPDDLQGDQASSIVYGTPAFVRVYGDRVATFSAFGAFRLHGGASGFDSFAEKARPLIGTEGAASLTSADDISQGVNDSLGVLSLAMLLLALAALLVGVVVGGQALARQLWLAAPDQPVLAALGLRRRERASAIVVLGAPVAVVAALVAALAAFLGSSLTPVSLGRQAEPHPGLRLDPLVHLGGAAAVAAVGFVGAVVVGWRLAGDRGAVSAGRLTPTPATRLAARLRLGPSATTGIRMALERGSGRATVPVRAALVGALVAVGGVVASLTFAASLDRLATTPARFGTPWDLQLDINTDDLGQVVRRPDVAAGGLLEYAAVVIEGQDGTGYAMDTRKGTPRFTVIDGRLPVADDEVALGPDELQRLDRSVGDTVALRGASQRLRIVGVVVTPGADKDPIASGAVLTPAGLKTVRQSDISLNVVIAWHEGIDHAAAERRMEAAFPHSISAYSHPRPPGEVVNLDRVRSLPLAFGGFLAAVGVAALAHALLTSARRRRHDLAVLRSLGFVRSQVAGALSWQASTIAAVGLLVGLPLGVAAGRWVWVLVADGVGVATDPRIPIAACGLVLTGALFVANVVGLPLGVGAGRVTPADVLRAE